MLSASIVAIGMLLAQARHSVLATELPVWDVLTADVNADGFKEILAYCSEDTARTPAKELDIFLAGAGGSFEGVTPIRYALPASNGTSFVSEFDGTPPREIVLVLVRSQLKSVIHS